MISQFKYEFILNYPWLYWWKGLRCRWCGQGCLCCLLDWIFGLCSRWGRRESAIPDMRKHGRLWEEWWQRDFWNEGCVYWFTGWIFAVVSESQCERDLVATVLLYVSTQTNKPPNYALDNMSAVAEQRLGTNIHNRENTDHLCRLHRVLMFLL